MSNHKYACKFAECGRVFDRWSRLEKHFRDHINGNIRSRGNARSAPPATSRTKLAKKRQHRKQRSSNMRNRYGLFTPNPSNSQMVIDLRTPSLSPDPLSATETSEVEEVLPPTPIAPSILQTPSITKKGPSWTVAPRTPSISPSPSASPTIPEEVDVQPTRSQSPPPSPPRARNDNPFLIDVESGIREDSETRDIPSLLRSRNRESPPQYAYNIPNSSSLDIGTNNGEKRMLNRLRLINPQSEISAVETSPQRQYPYPTPIISPFAKLSSAIPGSHQAYSGVDESDEPHSNQLYHTPTSKKADNTPPSPNSLDPFIEEARVSLELDRERTLTPCPSPRELSNPKDGEVMTNIEERRSCSSSSTIDLTPFMDYLQTPSTSTDSTVQQDISDDKEGKGRDDVAHSPTPGGQSDFAEKSKPPFSGSCHFSSLSSLQLVGTDQPVQDVSGKLLSPTDDILRLLREFKQNNRRNHEIIEEMEKLVPTMTCS
ncbi:uncharacterized protein L201_004736 [Kwoniella dendrophila CBS 6074]|uniref:C2H2-type domain-containing protein n=1 Tax=Kwoniella dendrophila CBS 6074 TaxID=1295534 RepID=A0AAX4JZ02_9TREE